MGLCVGRPRLESTLLEVNLCTLADCSTGRFFDVSVRTWDLLHRVSLVYPLKPRRVDRRRGWAFVVQVANGLPCSNCRHHWTTALLRVRAMGLDVLSTRSRFASWLYDMHNLWNHGLGKPHLTWTQFAALYRLTAEDGVEYVPIIHLRGDDKNTVPSLRRYAV